MCLTQRFNKAELAKFKKTLPADFPVWKVLHKCWPQVNSFESEFKFNKEPDLQFGVNKAGYYKGVRTNLKGKYKAGFHAFLSRYCARKYKGGNNYRIQKFYAKRSWITAAGKSLYDSQEYPQPIVVLSHIEMRQRLNNRLDNTSSSLTTS